MFERFKRQKTEENDSEYDPPMDALTPYDPTKRKHFIGIYVPTPEWIGLDTSDLTDEDKRRIMSQVEQPPALPSSEVAGA